MFIHDNITALFDRLVPIAFISFLPLLVLDAVVLDLLVRLEYSFHRRNWEKDGKPRGPVFVPPQSKMLGGLWISIRSRHALNRIMIAWFLRTPEWMRNEANALWLLLLHRLLWCVLLVTIFGLLLVMLFL